MVRLNSETCKQIPTHYVYMLIDWFMSFLLCM